MQSFFTHTGVHFIDFLQIACGFLLTMALVFNEGGGRRFWTNFMHVVFASQCLILILFREGLATKFFAGLMLLSTLLVRILKIKTGRRVSPGSV